MRFQGAELFGDHGEVILVVEVVSSSYALGGGLLLHVSPPARPSRCRRRRLRRRPGRDRSRRGSRGILLGQLRLQRVQLGGELRHAQHEIPDHDPQMFFDRHELMAVTIYVPTGAVAVDVTFPAVSIAR